MNWNGFDVAVEENVYRPGDDTFLLARAVQQEIEALADVRRRHGDARPVRFLEVGCGAGLVSLAAARAGAAVTAVDVNERAVGLARHNARRNGLSIEATHSDLLDRVADQAFDVVAFNPPYLPTAPEDRLPGPINLAFDGGPDGNDTVLRFADEIAGLAVRPGRILIVHSSLANPAPLGNRLAALGYEETVVAQEKHFFETITVRRFLQPGGRTDGSMERGSST